MRALLIDVGSTFIKYSVYDKEKGILFFDKTPFPEPIVNDEIHFIVSRTELLPKKKSVIVGGGGGDEVFSLIKDLLERLGIECFKADFNVGTQGLIALADQYIKEAD